MKHVFIINSHTMFLTSMGTVELEKLSNQDVIFIYTRNYCNSVSRIPFKTIQATDIADSCHNMLDNYNGKIRNVDEFIIQEIGESYHLYVPHLWHYFFQILYTNKLCKHLAYVQEGGPVQTKVYENDVPFFERLKSYIRLAILNRRTFECKWYKRGTIYKQHVLDSYAINNVYFCCLPSKNHIVQWPKEQLKMTLNPQTPIFIFDGFITNGSVERDVYLRCCKEMISNYATENNYVKFHPAQKKDERDILLSYFAKLGCGVEQMRDDIPTEYVILQFRHLTFIGFMSSLLYYAHDFGHNVICCEDLIIDNSPLYKKHLENTGFMTYGETYIK